MGRAASPCVHPGCPNLKPCAQHPINEHRHRQARQYYGAEYRRARKRALKRDKGQCQWPGCNTVIAVQAHHHVKVTAGGAHHEDNLTTYCQTHHRMAERVG